MKRRAVIFGLMFSFIIIIFMFRLLVLQVIPSSLTIQLFDHGKYKISNWKRTAVDQRSKQLQIDDGRAIFLDEHKIPLQTEQYTTIAFFPVKTWHNYSDHDDHELKQLAQILGLSGSELREWLSFQQYAQYWYDEQGLPVKLTEQQVSQLKQVKLEGFELIQYTARNGRQGSYKHIIGFTGEHPQWVEQHYAKEIKQLAHWDRNMQIGVSGLERSLDRLIHGLGPSYVTYTIDGSSRYMSGIGARIVDSGNRYYPLQVVTTLDYKLQIELERYMEQQGVVEGAIVLLDATNGDIKAMVSRPSLTPGQWTEIDENSWKNHATTAYEPGSIYKIITTAAALEYGVVTEDENFHCNGEYGKYGLSCWKKGGHGDQTLAQAFANSCNIVFATLAERLTAEQIDLTATALGAIYPVGWHMNDTKSPFSYPLRLLEEEENGVSVLSKKERDGGILAQTGIGQRDVRMTPLQAANMMVTIIHYGKQFQTRSVSSIRYADGLPVMEFPIQYGHEHRYRIQPQTASKLMSYMKDVVELGTAKQINGPKGWRLAGKTGTAQLGGKLSGLNNHWFVGFAPADSPRYAAAILIRKVPAGSSNKAPQIFKDIMGLAAEHDAEEQTSL